MTCCDKQPRNQLIFVSPTEDRVSLETAVISKKLQQEIVWKLPAGSTITSVSIILAGKPAPFLACRPNEGRCHISCANRLCASGPIDPSLPVPEKKPGPYYEYGFARGPSQASLDPGFRIDP